MTMISKRVGLTLVAAMVVTSAMAMPRNSYLVRPAKTHNELMQQVRTEPVVMDRFMRHFAMTRQEVLDYLGALRMGRLERTAVYQVYGVPKNGVLHATPQLLKRGTLVWEDASGQPILLEICGNPFTLGPKRVTMNDMVAVTPQATEGLVAMSTMPTTPVASAPMEIAMQPATPTQPVVIEPSVEPVPTSRRNDFAWLLAVPVAAGLALQDSGGEEPVPEPATMTAMAIGAGVMALKRRKANKK